MDLSVDPIYFFLRSIRSQLINWACNLDSAHYTNYSYICLEKASNVEIAYI